MLYYLSANKEVYASLCFVLLEHKISHCRFNVTIETLINMHTFHCEHMHKKSFKPLSSLLLNQRSYKYVTAFSQVASPAHCENNFGQEKSLAADFNLFPERKVI